MKPPTTINVIIGHVPGFTAITKPRSAEPEKLFRGDMLWRPASVLGDKDTTGTLIAYNEKSFFQSDNDVTLALYRVKGYAYPIAVWYRNTTGERIPW